VWQIEMVEEELARREQQVGSLEGKGVYYVT